MLSYWYFSLLAAAIPFAWTKQVTIVRNRMVSTLTILPKQFDISFDFYATKWIGGWTNILHLTTGPNCCGIGSRIPAIFPLGGKLHFAFAVSGNGNYVVPTPKLPLRKWMNFRINQRFEGGKYVFRVYYNNKVLRTVVNTRPQDFRNVKVWVGDNWYNAQPGFIRNLRITNKPINPATPKKREYIPSPLSSPVRFLPPFFFPVT